MLDTVESVLSKDFEGGSQSRSDWIDILIHPWPRSATCLPPDVTNFQGRRKDGRNDDDSHISTILV